MAFLGRAQAVAVPKIEAIDVSRIKRAVTAALARLRMHHILFVAFTTIAAVPVFSLAAWVENRAVQQEIDLARDKHLLVARNLTSAFSRYVFDVKAAFRLSVATFYSGEQAPGLKDLLTSLEFRHICIVDPDTGEVERYMPGFADATSPHIVLKPETIQGFKHQLQNDQIVITDLRRDVTGKPAFFLLKALPDGRIAYGVIGTDYLIELQRKIAFGARGHATILDAAGKVIAHPWQKWIDAEFDLSKTPPAKATMAGNTGVMQFFSPAFKAEMITAYTSVPETGWQVWVPQPMEELYAQANEVGRAATAIAFLSLVAAGLISWSLAKYISRPLKTVTATAGAIAEGDLNARAPDFAAYIPSELRRLADSFNHMLDELRRKNGELADAALRAEAASRAKSEFLANMSHELRTPLNAITGFSELMRDEVLGPMANQRYRSYANDIHESAQHLTGVITDILQLSKAEAGQISVQRQPAALPDIVEGTMRLVESAARDKQVELTAEIAPELAETALDTDPGKLTQILVNLVSNSIKFTKPGGSIALTAAALPDCVEIRVCDTGIGIAQADLETVMTPFGQVASAYQVRDGFGLGLPLSRKLTEALGGDFILESELGQGTNVTLRFPR